MSEAAPEAAELREALRAVLSVESGSRAVRAAITGGGELRGRLWQQLAELGWLGLTIPEDLGGLGLGLAELAIAYEELGRFLTPIPFLATMLAAEAIVDTAGFEHKRQWLPGIATGAMTASIALPRFSGCVTMTVVDSLLHLDGSLTHVLDAGTADLLLLPVGTDGKSVGLAVVERSSPGLSIAQRATVDATRALFDVRCEGVAVPKDRLLPVGPETWARLLDHASLALACDSAGGGARVLQMTVEYLKTRVQFGRPIGSFQALKHRCASWAILQKAVSIHVSESARACVTGRSAGIASAAKAYACDAYAAIAGDAIQLHGGVGFTWEHDCHLFFKRAKLNQTLFGGGAEHRDRAARALWPEAASHGDSDGY